MATDEFNPYQQWLGLDARLTQPSYYQLLGIAPSETDVHRIASLADRAALRVRSVHPGSRAAEWTRLLDELAAAKACLTDPTSRAQYDRQLTRQQPGPAGYRRPTPRPQTVPGAGMPMAPTAPAAGFAQMPAAPAAPVPAASYPPSSLPAAPMGQVPTGVPTGAPVAVPQAGAAPTASRAPAGPVLRKPTVSATRRRRKKSKLIPVLFGGTCFLMLAVVVLLVALVARRTKTATPSESPSDKRSVATPATTPQQRPGVRPSTRSTSRPSARQPGTKSQSPRPTPVRTVPPDHSTEPAPPDQSTEPAPPEPAPPVVADPKPDRSKPTAPAVPQPPSSTPPSRQEIQRLDAAVRAAREALARDDFDKARRELENVESLPKRPEDQAKFDRWKLLVGYARDFRSALSEAVGHLSPGSEIAIGADEVVAVVSATPQAVTIRRSGTSRRYPVDAMPVGLAIAIADTWLDQENPFSLVIKAAFVASRQNVPETHRAKARQWFREAAGRGADIGDLAAVLDDP